MIIDSSLRCTETEITTFFKSSLDEVTKLLTLPNPEYQNAKRFSKSKFFVTAPKYLTYLEKEGKDYLLPRYIFDDTILKKFPKHLRINNGRTGSYSLKDTFKLRDYQVTFEKTNKDALSDTSGLLIEMPCGHGKTVMAIYLTYKYRKMSQTMVVVPTYYLAKQWKKSIEYFTTASVYIVSSTDSKIPLDSDFTIIVTDLFSVRSLPKEFVDNVGHVILDEAHRMGAETYLPILKDIPAKYRTALTATFRRADGVHKILKYHFGKHIQMLNQFPKPKVYTVRTGVTIRGTLSKNTYPTKNLIEYMEARHIPFYETKTTVDFFTDFITLLDKDLEKRVITKTLYKEITRCIKAANNLAYTSVDSHLNAHSGRRKIVIKIITEALKAGRTVLFISKRKDVLKSLGEYFKKYKPMIIISETNNRTPEEEDYLQNRCRLVFGVTQLTKEGLDIDRLDTLLLHLPMKDTEQPIGRIARLHPTKKPPLAIYLLDNHPMLYSTYRSAQKIMAINGEVMGEVTLKGLLRVL